MLASMPSVIVDKEEVVFKEGVPACPSQVYDLLDGELAKLERVMVRFCVDGVDILREDSNPTSFEKIEVTSQTHHQLTLRLIVEANRHLANFEIELAAYAANVLKTPWSQVFQRMDELVAKIKPFADLLDNLLPYAHTYDPAWKDGLEEVSGKHAESLNRVLTCFEKGSPADLSDELSGNFSQAYKEGSRFISSEVIPFLEKKTAVEAE